MQSFEKENKIQFYKHNHIILLHYYILCMHTLKYFYS